MVSRARTVPGQPAPFLVCVPTERAAAMADSKHERRGAEYLGRDPRGEGAEMTADQSLAILAFFGQLLAAVLSGLGAGWLSGRAAGTKIASDERIARGKLESELSRWRATVAREDRYRFVDVKLSRYAAFMSEAEKIDANLKQQRASADEFAAGNLADDQVPILDTTDRLRDLVSEISLLSPEVGQRAQDAYMELVWATKAFAHHAGAGIPEAGNYAALVQRLTTAYYPKERLFREAARADLGTDKEP